MATFFESYSKGFFMAPNKVFDFVAEGKLDKNQFMILMYILSLNNFRFHKTSRTQIANKLKMKRETVAECLNYLTSLGFVEIESKGLYMIIHSNIVYQGEIKIKTQKEQKEEVENETTQPDISEPDPIRGVLPAPIRGVLPDPNRGTIEVSIEKRLEVVENCCDKATTTTTISKDLIRKLAKRFGMTNDQIIKGYNHYCELFPEKKTPFRIMLSKSFTASEFKALIIDADKSMVLRESAKNEEMQAFLRRQAREEKERKDLEEFMKYNAYKYKTEN